MSGNSSQKITKWELNANVRQIFCVCSVYKISHSFEVLRDTNMPRTCEWGIGVSDENRCILLVRYYWHANTCRF